MQQSLEYSELVIKTIIINTRELEINYLPTKNDINYIKES